MIDHEKVEQAVRLLLEGIGEDVNREGLIDTPDRIARMYEEIFGGLTQTAEEPLSKTFHVKDNAMVLLHSIQPVSIIYCLFMEKPILPIFRMVRW